LAGKFRLIANIFGTEQDIDNRIGKQRCKLQSFLRVMTNV